MDYLFDPELFKPTPQKAADGSRLTDETDDEFKKRLENEGWTEEQIKEALAGKTVFPKYFLDGTPAQSGRAPSGVKSVMQGLGFSKEEIAKAIASTPAVKVDYSTPQGAAAANAAVSSGPGSGDSIFDIMRNARKAEPPKPAVATATTPRGSRTALARGAPSGTEEAREFARGLFAVSQAAQQDLDRYRKANPKADANDPQLKSLQDAVSSASADAQAGVSWATMTPSARQSVLTQEDLAAQKGRTAFMTNSFSEETAGQELEAKAGRRNLIEDGNYFNQTGVMRGGAGVGTSTTPGGGVISAPDASGSRTLNSPKYGTGSITYLTPEQMKNRPEAILDGKPASQFFDEAAMRQGRTFTVGDATYSPEMSPADRAQKDLDEQKRKAEEERKKFASQIMKK